MDLKRLKEAFDDFECSDHVVFDSAMGLSMQLGKDASEIAEEYELYAMNRKKLQDPITPAFFSAFAENLKAKEKMKENVGTNRLHGTVSAILSDTPGKGSPSVLKSPASHLLTTPPNLSQPRPMDIDPTPGISPLAASASHISFNSQPLLNSGVTKAVQAGAARAEIQHAHLFKSLGTLSAYLPAAAAHLERRINAMEGHLRRCGWNVTAVHTGSENDVAVCGRICHSADAGAGSESTLELEGSRAVSDGARVKLDCTLLTEFSFFPGQVVGIKGRNPTGSCLTAHTVVDTLPVAERDTTIEGGHERANGACRMIVAVGPFVPVSGQLSFVALQAVVERCRAQTPDVLLLCGPFVPDTHPDLPNIRISFKDLFAQQVLGPLQELRSACPEMQIMLQPAVADAHHLPVHPQPPLPPCSPLEMLPSPANVACGGCRVSVSSSSVLMHLSSSEVGKLAGQDRISRLFKHVLEQRTFYPVFPAAIDACVDFAHSKHLDMAQTPDVLILPAPFAPCAKVVQCGAAEQGKGHAAICINPGLACKGTAGTFVEVMIPDTACFDTSKVQISTVKWTRPDS